MESPFPKIQFNVSTPNWPKITNEFSIKLGVDGIEVGDYNEPQETVSLRPLRLFENKKQHNLIEPNRPRKIKIED